ncbi:MAG: hypothetical protein IJP42_07100 [Selenomonadaceae bacterium]|nr:hypothetical protein [Selenomonadaceae bacterium]
MAKANEINEEQFEQDFVAGMLEAAKTRINPETPTIKIIRDEKVLFTFRVRALDEDEWQSCRRKSLMNRGKPTEEVNNARFINQVIYEATLEEDKEKTWKVKQLWKQFGVVTGSELVGKILSVGEKNKIFEVISNLSGYYDDYEDMVKN